MKEAAEKFDEAAKKAAKQAEAGGAEIAKGLEAMAQGLAGAASAVGGNGKPVTPVSFRAAAGGVSDLPGLDKGKPTGEKMTAPVAFSQAEVRYTKGDGRIELKIVDSGFHQLLLAPYTVFLTSRLRTADRERLREVHEGRQRAGLGEVERRRKTGEVNAVVAKRFLVQAEGRGVEDIKVLHDVIGKIDFVRLAAMK